MRRATLAVVFVSLAVSCTTRERAAAPVADCVGVKDCRPKMAVDTLSGGKIGDEALSGQVVLVNFWATWCGPCKKELPALQAVYDRHKGEGFTILGMVTADQATDSEILNFAAKRKVAYPLVRGEASLESKFDLGNALPTSMLYDRRGRLVKRWMGDIEEGELENAVRGTLAQ